MSVRVGTKVGQKSWVSMGIFGWLVVGLIGLALFALVFLWPLAVLTGLFPHQVWAVVVGWIITVAWWILLGWYGLEKRKAKAGTQ